MRRGFLLSVPKPTPPMPPPSSSSESSDRLSSLPDVILLEIMSLLCTDEIVRTGILSRRWRGLWTRSPVLHLVRNYSTSFLERVDVDLLSVTDLLLSQCSSNPKIVSASFPLSDDPAASLRADRCIRFASARSVERLSFSSIVLGRLCVPVPPSLFSCRSLTELRLSSCSISSSAVPSRKNKKKMRFFPMLRTIMLTSVSIDDAQMEALLENCPVLESLSLSMIREITRLVIRAPHMRHLMVFYCGGLVQVELVEAPEIRRLMYSGDLSMIGNLEGKVPKVEEVALVSTEGVPFKNPAGWRRLVGAVATARVLSVSSWFFKFPLTAFGPGGQEVVFKNLKELHWWPVYHKSPNALGVCAEKISTSSLHPLLSMLRDCPSLELLCIRATFNLEHELDDMYWIRRHFSSRQYRAEELSLNIDSVGYEFPCLKTLNIAEFSGRKVEMKLVKFIAENATALESVNLHYVEDIQSDVEGIQRVFTSIQTASPHATISFSEFDEDKVCSKHENMWYDYTW